MKRKVTVTVFAVIILVAVPVFAAPQTIVSTAANVIYDEKSANTDILFGRQPLIIGEGMFFAMNGMKSIYMGANKSRFHAIGFVSQPNQESSKLDSISLDIGATVLGVNVGVGYVKVNDMGDSKYWSFNAGTKIAERITLSGSYMKNDKSAAEGYLVQATFGNIVQKGNVNYAVSYRVVEEQAVNTDWITTEAYANSKGFRATANYRVTENGTLSLYRDFTIRYDDETIQPNQIRAEFNVIF